MKYLILVADGLADFPLEELGGKTPLAQADTPNLDRLARDGQLHTLVTVPEGMPPGSDVANLSLLGYDPSRCYTGRAPLEAASLQVALRGADLAFRCNLVNLDLTDPSRPRMLDYSAGHISTPEARELILSLAAELNGPHLAFYPGVSYRHLLVTDQELGPLATTPPHDHSGQEVADFWNGYLDHPVFGPLVRRAGEILAQHPVNQARVKAGKTPANAIWLWGEGQAPQLATLKERFGITGALISAVDLLKGIGVYAGMEVIEVPGATGYLDTNYQGKAQGAMEALTRHDLVFVHVEAPDEAGHQGLIAEKIQAIEDFDKKIVAPIVAGLAGTDYRLVVTCDHFTPIRIKTHAGLPVPLIMFDSRQAGGGHGPAYTEDNAKAAGSPIPGGAEFLSLLLGR